MYYNKKWDNFCNIGVTIATAEELLSAFTANQQNPPAQVKCHPVGSFAGYQWCNIAMVLLDLNATGKIGHIKNTYLWTPFHMFMFCEYFDKNAAFKCHGQQDQMCHPMGNCTITWKSNWLPRDVLVDFHLCHAKNNGCHKGKLNDTLWFNTRQIVYFHHIIKPLW